MKPITKPTNTPQAQRPSGPRLSFDGDLPLRPAAGRVVLGVLTILMIAWALAASTAMAASTFGSRIDTNSGIGVGSGITAMKLADFNRDGKLDVVVVGEPGNGPSINVAVGLGNGDGTFAMKPIIAFGPTLSANQGGPISVDVGDFNGDGILDIVVCQNAAGNVYMLYGNGDGTFQAPKIIPLQLNGTPYCLAVGDFNGDGIQDIAITLQNSPTLQILFGAGDGTFAQVQIALSGVGKYIVAGDLDLDGTTDLGILTDSSWITIRKLNTINPALSEVSNIGGGQAVQAAIGNLHGAGQLPSMVMTKFQVGSDFSLTSTIFLQQSWDSPGVSVVASGSADFDPVAIADLDLNGYGDIIYGNDQTGVGILYTSANGNVSSPQTLNALGYVVAVGDLNGDGLLDVVSESGDFANHYISVFLQQTSPGHPLITSGNQATFSLGQSNQFQVTASGTPSPAFSVTGTLPAGVTFGSNGSLSGTPAAGTTGNYPLVITASNGAPPNVTQNFTLTVVGTAPVVTNPSFDSVTNSSAHLYGTVTNDGGFPLTRRGIVYALTSVNPNPALGGTGVVAVDDPQQFLGTFNETVTGLSASTNYSFAAFAVNSQGTGYSPVATFQTNPPPGNGSLVVTTTVDEDNGTSDPGVGAGTSLREAVAYANALGGNQTITFSPNLFANGPATIALAQSLGPIQFANLSGTTTITGPGASLLTVSGNGLVEIFNENQGAAGLSGMTLANGAASGNGGVIRSAGTLYLQDCVFTNNASSISGGAIYNGNLGYFSRCTFMNNSAASSQGGGAIANEGTVWVMNCTFSGNSAKQGGAISNVLSGAFAHVICSTITNNSASTAGGGLSANSSQRMFVYDSIVSGNSAPSGANITGTLGGLASSLVDADPSAIFTTGQLAYNGGPTPTIALKPGGPAVNAGSNSLAVDYNSAPLTTDQSGKPRVINGTVDIGAYETPVLPAIAALTATNITATTATLRGNVTGDGFGNISKRGVVYALTSQNANPAIGGPGVAEVDASGTTGIFTVPVSGLTALAGYSFTSFVTNEIGTVYAPVQTFETTELPSLVVTTVSDTTNSYDGQTSLREALAYAQSLGGAQTITFAPSLAGQSITVSNGWNDATDDTALRVSGNVTVDGGSGVTINLAAPVARRLFLNGGTLTLRNLTLSGGNIQGANDGGALWSNGTTTLDTVLLTNNKANNGGAVESFGALTVRNCAFSGNYAQLDGGAVHSATGSSSLQIDNSTFSGNSTGATANAIASGAQQNTYRYLTITNNSGGAGVINVYQHPATMIDCIIDGNSPDGILEGNGGTLTAQSTNNILGSGGTGGLANGVNGNLTGVPMAQLLLGALANNGGPTPTIALQPGSLAVDAGAAIAGLTTDQRGVSRLQGNAVDIGAFELAPSVAAAIPIVSPLGGAYQNNVQVSITSTSARTVVRYTLDGSDPSSTNGLLYTGPFNVTQSGTVKAIAYNGGWLPSPIASAGFTVLSPLPYWRNLQGLPANGSQDLATPAGDGVANLLKYAFNMAPHAGDLARANVQVMAANGAAGLPTFGIDAQGRLVLQFVRRKASNSPSVAYIVETGSDLHSLMELSLVGASVVSIDSTWERVTVTDPTVSPNRFGHVRILPLGTYFNNFNAGLGAATLRGSAAYVNQAVQVTDAVPGQIGAVTFDGINLVPEVTGFTAQFNLQLGPTTTGIPADGGSFAVGNLGTGAWAEGGPSTTHNIAVGFDTYDNGTVQSGIGIHLWVNGVDIADSASNPYTNGQLVPVVISYDAATGLTVTFNGAVIFSNTPVSGFTFQATDKFGFGARTGGADERCVVDDVQIAPR